MTEIDLATATEDEIANAYISEEDLMRAHEILTEATETDMDKLEKRITKGKEMIAQEEQVLAVATAAIDRAKTGARLPRPMFMSQVKARNSALKNLKRYRAHMAKLTAQYKHHRQPVLPGVVEQAAHA